MMEQSLSLFRKALIVASATRTHAPDCGISMKTIARSISSSLSLCELASKIYAWSVFVSLLSVPYRFPWFWILQVCIHRGIVFCQSPIVFQGKSRKQHRDETSLTKVVDDNFEVASYGGCPTKLFFLSLYRRPFATLSRLQKNHRFSFRAL